MIRILIAEDTEDLRNAIVRVLKRRGFDTVAVGDGDSAIAKIRRENFDLALLDIRMPGRNGLEVLEEIKVLSPSTRVILMTAYACIDSAVKAIREEAADYLLKPFSTEEMEDRIQQVLDRYHLSHEKILEDVNQGKLLIGNSPSLNHIRDLIGKIAPTTSPVLILGESGTGKEVLAQEIHRLSLRRDRRFVAINCVALAEGVLESELFGHERGAFTGAISQKVGLLETAKGGTVFLDEIGECSPSIQVKLLRFLQEHEIQRVGGTSTIKVDARVIAATNRDLNAEVRAKRFREDLLYRLNVFDITMPPLRERMEDLPLLMEYFTTIFQRRLRKKTRFSPEAIAAMQSYRWPGNIRELENVIERAVVLAQHGEMGLQDLPQRVLGNQPAVPKVSPKTTESHRKWLGNLEREVILRALEENRWNQVRTARRLGIKRSTLQYRMQKHAISRRQSGEERTKLF